MFHRQGGGSLAINRRRGVVTGSELDERSRPLFTPITQAPSLAAGLLLGDDGVAVIRKNDHEEPVETRLFQAPLG